MSDVPMAVGQLLLSLLAGAALFLLWRAAAGKDRVVYWLVTAGVLARAVAGVALFWISYLSLPFARSLQAGRGIWFFALDSFWYLDIAAAIASGGPTNLLPLWPGIPSPLYNHSLAALTLFFGTSAVIGLLLNTASFLASCLLILKIGEDAPVRARRFAIGALSLSPTAILWSLQPLKDTFFVFLLILFVAACHRWQKLAVTAGDAYPFGGMLVATLFVTAAQVGVSDVRWYFGLVLLVGSVPFLLMTIARTTRRAVTIAFAVVLLPLLLAAMIVGGGRQVPLRIQKPWLSPSASTGGTNPPGVVLALDYARGAYDREPAASLVGVGDVVMAMERTRRPYPGAHVIPVSRSGRLITGMAAIFLPRVAGTALGLVDIRGGRSLWLFAEVDTVIFLGVVAYALWCLGRTIRRPRALTPLFWLVATVMVSITFALVYTISNFGTLFRHRGMIFVLLLLIPLTIAPSSEPET